MGTDSEPSGRGGRDSDADSEYGILAELLVGNRHHVNSLPEDYFADVQVEQHPDIVAISCSDSRVPQEDMWGVDHAGQVFTPSNIGNQVWDEDDGERIVDGGLLYPIHHTDTEVAAVVGHTGCGAITAAYRVATGDSLPGPQGVDKWIRMLVPVVEDALESDLIDANADDDLVINQLVEYNVDHQAEFLRNSPNVPDGIDIYGFVYDFQGVYGDDHGCAYLVNVNGTMEPDAIAEQLPEEYEPITQSLLY
ncbi:carbonic anhydrase [Natronolimnobius sp. AArcel1]|uniref:carbonic anhydrase n=1 Tax=Natronolimnobius sp. AArcel1 TaxID=1679093 RepID=UPI0013EC271B|nr:carbonic anhydrase [Natronolimnobius sp. AArcel1]NGM68577.1 carbonic anhydrase [Natronolimnobius sp. AArcel1]